MSDLIITEKDNLVAIADAVRNVTDSNEQLSLEEVAENINLMTGFIPTPAKAEVGQILKVTEIDENGRPTGWQAVDQIRYVASDVEPNDTSVMWIDTADNTDDFKQIIVDPTLSSSGCAADAKKTGEAISLKADLNYVMNLEENKIAQLELESNNLKQQLNNLKKVYVGSVEPTEVVDGMLWIDTSDDQQIENNNEV